ncbi:MAG: transcriptional regulator [Calditrichaeota bacterium]|nr:transcriptional regulator [Calditrichota bacterium]MCB9369263.1 transcriptional regulator [Calditrichota bacterium]
MFSDDAAAGKGGIPEIDLVVHSPARLAILGLLSVAKVSDFLFLEKQTGLTRGNLSTHLTKLESAGYVHIEKKFEGRMPRTLIHLTKEGRTALKTYRQQMEEALRDLPE